MAEAIRWLGRGVAICLLPVLLALDVAAGTFPGGTTIPWRPVMVDLDVYRLAGRVLLDGGDFYRLPGALMIIGVLHRWGQTGWRLSLWSAVVIYVVLPVSQTLAFGQLGIVLVAL